MAFCALFLALLPALLAEQLPAYALAMLAFEGNEVGPVLRALENTGAPAAVFLDPTLPTFSKDAVRKVTAHGHMAGLYVQNLAKDSEPNREAPPDKEDAKHVAVDYSGILAAKQAFTEKAGIVPTLVAFGDSRAALDAATGSEEFRTFLTANALVYKAPSLIEPADLRKLYWTVEALVPQNGPVSLLLKSADSSRRIENIINHLRRRCYNIVHPRRYLNSSLASIAKLPTRLREKKSEPTPIRELALATAPLFSLREDVDLTSAQTQAGNDGTGKAENGAADIFAYSSLFWPIASGLLYCN
ncbi:hypothetical protein PAPHI01_0907 [Pancytospora philotis]|nr:hypothetical protein PAPHI01_0907 [Pancytospora philotis]